MHGNLLIYSMYNEVVAEFKFLAKRPEKKTQSEIMGISIWSLVGCSPYIYIGWFSLGRTKKRGRSQPSSWHPLHVSLVFGKKSRCHRNSRSMLAFVPSSRCDFNGMKRTMTISHNALLILLTHHCTIEGAL